MGMFPPAPAPSGNGSGGGGRRSPPAPSPGGPAHPRPPSHDPLAIPGSGGRGGLPLADIGRRDLEPLGGMGGTFGGGLPGGLGGFGGGGTGGMGGMGGGGGGGMFMGPDHPLFRERFGPGNDIVGGGGAGGGGRRWGGDGYLPPIGAPQGARFDPVGPTVRLFSLSLFSPCTERVLTSRSGRASSQNGPPTGGLGGPNAGGGPSRPGQPPSQGQQPHQRTAHPDMEVRRGLFSPLPLCTARTVMMRCATMAILALTRGGAGRVTRVQQPGTNSEWQNSMFG